MRFLLRVGSSRLARAFQAPRNSPERRRGQEVLPSILPWREHDGLRGRRCCSSLRQARAFSIFGATAPNHHERTGKPRFPSASAVAGDMVTIEEAMKWARPGDTVTIPPGSYRISRLVVDAEPRSFTRPQGATIIGDMVVRGPQTAIRGFTFAAATVDISNSQSVTIGDCAYDGGTTASKLGRRKRRAHYKQRFPCREGGVNTGSGLDRSTISGNHFLDCGQCIKLTSTMIRRVD